MVKSNHPINKIGKYIRELSVVVVGIAITVSLGILVNNSNNKKDLELYLNAVKLELQQNIEDIEDQIELMQESVKYADYLKAHNKKSLNSDSIMSYANAFYTVQSITFKTYAFEMLKLSGTMRLMDDKELLFSLWEAYTNMDALKSLLEMGIQLKFEEMKKELPMIADGKTDFIPMFTFYVATPWAYEMPRVCADVSAKLKETVSKMEK